MSITTYAELQTAITEWMKRSALSGRAADIITLCESDIKTRFNGRTFETNATLTGEVDSRELDSDEGFPSDYKSSVSLYLTTYGDEIKLTKNAAGDFMLDSDSGPPDEWAIDNNKVILDRPCDVAHTFRFRYRQTLALSDSATTNWLLTNFPNVYLTGSLHWAHMYSFKGQDPSQWGQAFNSAIEGVDWNESRDRNAPLQVDPALMLAGGGGFNINDGDAD